MSNVTAFINEIDYWAWNRAACFAETSPNVAKIILTLPIVVGTIARDLLANPAKCIEEIVRLPSDGKISNVIIYTIYSAFSPITAIIDTIVSIASFLWDPAGYSKRCSDSSLRKVLHGEEILDTIANHSLAVNRELVARIPDNVSAEMKNIIRQIYSNKLWELISSMPLSPLKGITEREEIIAQLCQAYASPEDHKKLKDEIINRLVQWGNRNQRIADDVKAIVTGISADLGEDLPQEIRDRIDNI